MTINTLKVDCPSCQSSYWLEDEIARSNKRFECSTCGCIFLASFANEHKETIGTYRHTAQVLVEEPQAQAAKDEKSTPKNEPIWTKKRMFSRSSGKSTLQGDSGGAPSPFDSQPNSRSEPNDLESSSHRGQDRAQNLSLAQLSNRRIAGDQRRDSGLHKSPTPASPTTGVQEWPWEQSPSYMTTPSQSNGNSTAPNHIPHSHESTMMMSQEGIGLWGRSASTVIASVAFFTLAYYGLEGMVPASNLPDPWVVNDLLRGKQVVGIESIQWQSDLEGSPTPQALKPVAALPANPVNTPKAIKDPRIVYIPPDNLAGDNLAGDNLAGDIRLPKPTPIVPERKDNPGARIAYIVVRNARPWRTPMPTLRAAAIRVAPAAAATPTLDASNPSSYQSPMEPVEIVWGQNRSNARVATNKSVNAPMDTQDVFGEGMLWLGPGERVRIELTLMEGIKVQELVVQLGNESLRLNQDDKVSSTRVVNAKSNTGTSNPRPSIRAYANVSRNATTAPHS